MEESGLMMEMIQKMRISKRSSLMVIPALFGLLPVPGGALMSAPILHQIDTEEDANKKVSINVWYRHTLILIYPLSSSVILASILTNINLYIIVIGLLPGLILMWIIGYITLVKNVAAGSLLNNCGIIIKLRPSFPAFKAASACSKVGDSEKMAGIIASPANNDAELLPNPVINEFKTMSSFSFI